MHSVFLVICALLLGTVHCLFEDEVGKRDWYKEKIGEVQQVAFPTHPRLIKRKLFYVATAEHTVAALHVQTGDVVWRRVLAKDEEVNSFRLYEKVLVVVSDNRFLTAWDAEDGTVLWSALLESDYGGEILFKGFLAAQGRTASLVGVDTEAARLQVFTFDWPDGGNLGSKLISLPADFWDGMGPFRVGWRREKFVNLLTQMSVNGMLLVSPIQSKATFFSGVDGTFSELLHFASLLPENSTPDALLLPNARHFCKNFLLQLSTTQALVIGVTDGRLRASHSVSLSATDAVSVCDSSMEDERLLVLRAKGDASATDIGLYAISPNDDGVKRVDFSAEESQLIEAQIPGAMPAASGTFKLAAVQTYSAKRDGLLGYRAVVVMEDATVSLVEKTANVWHRVEGLASIQDALFVNLAKAGGTEDLEHSNVVMRFVHRTIFQMITFKESLQSFAHWVAEETIHRVKGVTPPKQWAEDDVGVDGQELPMTQDSFGFRKLILAHSRAPILYAIHTAKGQIAWKRFLKYDAVRVLLRNRDKRDLDTESFIRFAHKCKVSTLASYHLDSKQGTHMKHEYLMVLSVSVYDGPEYATLWGVAKEEHTIVLTFEVQKGELVDSAVYPVGLLHSMLVPFQYHFGVPDDGTSSVPLLLVDTDLKTHMYPKKQEAEEAIVAQASKIFFYITDSITGRVTGYSLSRDARRAQEVWRIGVDLEKGEDIVAVSYLDADRQNFVVHNSVKLFNNASRSNPNAPDYGFKYTDPNLFGVATAVPAPPPIDEKSGRGRMGPSLNLYIIDGVTGNILHQMNHPNAVPPVTMLSVENYLLYHYLNVKHMKYQMGVWEFFDDAVSPGGNPVAEGMINSVMGSKPLARSSFLTAPPIIQRNVFSYPTAINCLSTSVTSKGITTKLIMAGDAQGKVVGIMLPALEKSKVNAITYPTQSIITYNKTVHKLHRIRASPAALESTSHVLAIGMDLFYTRVSPAKSYDLLGDDFSYWLVLTTTSGLVVATFVAKALAKRRSLALAWS